MRLTLFAKFACLTPASKAGADFHQAAQFRGLPFAIRRCSWYKRSLPVPFYRMDSSTRMLSRSFCFSPSVSSP